MMEITHKIEFSGYSSEECHGQMREKRRTMYVRYSKYVILLIERPRGMLNMDVALSQTPKNDGRGEENASGRGWG